MVYWNTKPPPGPLSDTATIVLTVAAAVAALPVIYVIVAYCIGMVQLLTH